MKKSIFAFLFLVPFVCSVNLWADKAGYTITNYSFDGVYHSDNSVTVREEIDVFFYEPRHGIYHSIPCEFYLNVSDNEYADDIKHYSSKIKKFKSNAPSKKETEGINKIFRLGSKFKKITGPEKYIMTYTYVFPDDRYDFADFIYYSVLGSEWATEIEHFQFSLAFDDPIPDNLQISSGYYGSTGNNLNIKTYIKDNTIYGSADFIPPNDAITIYGRIPEGYFSNERVAVFTPLIWFLYVIAFAFTAFALFKCIFTVPKKPVQTVEFYPPEGISSAEVGYIIDNTIDSIDLISLIPFFAHKELLTISEVKKGLKTHTILTKLKDIPENYPEYQKAFFKALFHKGNELDLSKLPSSFGEKIEGVRNDLKNEFKGEKCLFENEKRPFQLCLITSALVAFFGINDTVVDYFSNFIAIAVPVVILCLSLFKEKWACKRHISKKKFILWMFLSFVCPVITALFFYSETSNYTAENIVPTWMSILLLTMNGLVGIFNYRLLVPSKWSLEINGKLMGLKEFIRTAEMPKLKKLLDDNPGYFYDVLPYAMVFELADKWAKQFKNLEVEKPVWYSSDFSTSFNTTSLVHTINSGISSSMAKATSTGGSSGGGGGGGGGGSW